MMIRIAVCALLAAALASPALAGERGAPTADCPQGVLTMTVLKPLNNPPTPPMVAAWEAANRCMKIELNEVPFGQLADKISVLAASGNPPDIVMYDGPNTQTYAAAGVLMPLEKYFPPGLKDDMIAATLSEHSYDGHIFSPGTQQSSLALFYNADMLAPLGIVPPRDLDKAWTWDQAVEAMKKCQKGDGRQRHRLGPGAEPLRQCHARFRVSATFCFVRTFGDPKAPPEIDPSTRPIGVFRETARRRKAG